MKHPPPHSFSRSPVEEVFCCCTYGSDAELLSLTIPLPYPGWPHIRDRIRDMIARRGDVSQITGCMLRYTDLIPIAEGKDLPGTAEIGQALSGRYDCYFDNEQKIFVLTSTEILYTAGSVCSIYNRPGKSGWILVFTMKTDQPTRFVSDESVLNWFDDARTGIHELFDLIVPEKVVQILK